MIAKHLFSTGQSSNIRFLSLISGVLCLTALRIDSRVGPIGSLFVQFSKVFRVELEDQVV